MWLEARSAKGKEIGVGFLRIMMTFGPLYHDFWTQM